MSTVQRADKAGSHSPSEHELAVRVFLDREDDHWNAVALDYTVVGVGATQEEAVSEMVELLLVYLASCYADGVLPPDASRPVPWRWRLEMHAKTVLSRVGRVAHHAGAAREVRVALPSSQFASC